MATAVLVANTGITLAGNTINSADAITNWTGENGVEPDIKVEGTNSIAAILRQDGAVLSYDAASFTATNQHIRGWIQFTALGDLDFMEMFLSDGTNTAFWEIFRGQNYAGANNPPLYRGGWFYSIIDFSSTPDSGTTPTGTITQVGYRFQRVSQPRQVVNTFADVLRYGDGYTVTGGTSGDPVTFADIATTDSADAYGIVQNERDVNFLYGEIRLGNGATATFVSIKNEPLIFTNSSVASGLYSIIGQGSGCDVVVEGSLIKSNGTTTNTKYDFDMSDANLNSLTFSGNSLIRGNSFTFKTGQTIDACTFIDCGVVTLGGATIQDSVFEGSTGTSAILTTSLNSISNCEFTEGGVTSYAVQVNSSTSANYSWNSTASGYTGLPASVGNNVGVTPTGNETIFINDSNTGNTYNITVTSTGTIPSVASAGAVVNVNQDITITLTNIRDGSEVRVFDSEDNAAPYATPTELAGVENLTGGVDVGGTANNGTVGGTTNANTFAFNIASGTTVYIKVFNTGFIADVIEDTYTTTQSVQINQRVDRVFNT